MPHFFFQSMYPFENPLLFSLLFFASLSDLL